MDGWLVLYLVDGVVTRPFISRAWEVEVIRLRWLSWSLSHGASSGVPHMSGRCAARAREAWRQAAITARSAVFRVCTGPTAKISFRETSLAGVSRRPKQLCPGQKLSLRNFFSRRGCMNCYRDAGWAYSRSPDDDKHAASRIRAAIFYPSKACTSKRR